jgi:hypothetical protein
MSDVYDKERTAALIKEARQITADFKVETESIKRQMDRVLEGGGDEEKFCGASDGETVAHDADLSGATPPTDRSRPCSSLSATVHGRFLRPQSICMRHKNTHSFARIAAMPSSRSCTPLWGMVSPGAHPAASGLIPA